MIETATAACSVALIDGDVVVAERHEVVGRGHAERLVSQIAELLAEQTAARPSAILVDCGPGSFTGVRVGLSAARALGLAWGVPVHGCSATALIAAVAMGDADRATVALAGGHGELFVESFTARPLRSLGPISSLRPEDAARHSEALVIGSGAAALVAARGSGEARDTLPRAADASLLPPDFASLPPSPIYGRAPDARPPA